MEEKYYKSLYFICSVAFKWLQSSEIDFHPNGDIKRLQDINQFMAARCKYDLFLIESFFFLFGFLIAGLLFRSKGHALLKLAEFIEVINF